jgi:hypothetical protein
MCKSCQKKLDADKPLNLILQNHIINNKPIIIIIIII